MYQPLYWTANNFLNVLSDRISKDSSAIFTRFVKSGQHRDGVHLMNIDMEFSVILKNYSINAIKLCLLNTSDNRTFFEPMEIIKRTLNIIEKSGNSIFLTDALPQEFSL